MVSLLLVAGFMGMAATASAARLEGAADSGFWQRTWEFWTFQSETVRTAALASILLGTLLGVLGSFTLVRKMALAGDAIGHAVLPGVCIGFLLSGSKASWMVVTGATGAGLLGAYLLGAITKTTRLKPDAAMALILSSFFGIGICLLTYIQQLPWGGKAGLNSFLFGQVAGVGPDELLQMGIISVAVIGVVSFFFQDLQTFSFDGEFAASVGIRTGLMHHLFMFLMALAIVVAIQAVGVVLVAAMLIMPAATAYLLCNRLVTMLPVSAALGMASGLLGSYCSFLGVGLPTGPFMVVAAASLFTLALVFAPERGFLPRWMRHRLTAKRIEMENTLKAAYKFLERQGADNRRLAFTDIAGDRIGDEAEVRQRVARIAKAGLAAADARGFELTRRGFRRAKEIVRNHRLWELYLVTKADVAPDHVHDDAEKIEHILGEEMVARLERRLKFPSHDPHGKPIPGPADAELGDVVKREGVKAPHEVVLSRYRGGGQIHK